MSSVLTINGVAINRPAARVTLDKVTISMDAPQVLEFTEHRLAATSGTYSEDQSCTLSVDGVAAFSGWIGRAEPVNIGRGCIDVGYTAMGLDWYAGQIPITAADGTGAMAFNLPSTDPNYVLGNSGKSVGAMVKEVLDLHATQLTAIGVTGYSATELAAMVVVPPVPVVFSGQLWPAIQDVITTWCNKYVPWIAPSDTLVHVVSTLTGLTPITLTLDQDPITLTGPSRDHSESFSRVVVRGAANVQGAYLRLSDMTLTKGWTSAQELAWTLTDFTQPKQGASTGTITSMTSTTATVTSSSATQTWAANYWATQEAYMWSYNPAATGLTFTEEHAVTACTALAAGGSSVLTIDSPYSGTGYTKYALRGNMTGQAVVWRKFLISPTWVAQHCQQNFAHSVPFSTSSAAVAQTWTVAAVVCWSSSGSAPFQEFPATVQVVQYDGTTNGFLIFDQPIVSVFNSQSNLLAGGSSVQQPGDLIVLVPYSRGAMSVTVPTTGYQGTSYTVDNLERTLTLDYPDWLDIRNAPAMTVLAQEHLDTRKDTVVEGTVTYHGMYAAALVLGSSLNIAIAGGLTTGWESLGAPIRSASLTWPQDGADLWTTEIGFSTRRRPFSGDRLYIHPAYAAPTGGFGASDLSINAGVSAEGAGIGFDVGPSSIVDAPTSFNPQLDDAMSHVNDPSGIEPVDSSGLPRRAKNTKTESQRKDARASARKQQRQDAKDAEEDAAGQRDWDAMGPSKAAQRKEARAANLKAKKDARKARSDRRKGKPKPPAPGNVPDAAPGDQGQGDAKGDGTEGDNF